MSLLTYTRSHLPNTHQCRVIHRTRFSSRNPFASSPAHYKYTPSPKTPSSPSHSSSETFSLPLAMAPTNLPIVAVVFVALLFLTPSLCQETEDEREFSYEEDSENGPKHWGNIHPDWAACGKGKLQSPIDLDNERVQILTHLGRLRRTYRPASATMVNRGHDIMIKWEEEAGGIWVDGTEYKLKQLHWHSPSEHTIDGVKLAMELHLVHESADKKIAVVGVLYKLGRPDKFIKKMSKYIEELEDEEHNAEEKLGVVDPMEVKWGSRKFYRYMGSLTVPPCTEGVMWSIIKKVRTVSKEQVNLLREAVHDEHEKNARPTQPINSRVVGLYRPKNNEH